MDVMIGRTWSKVERSSCSLDFAEEILFDS